MIEELNTLNAIKLPSLPFNLDSSAFGESERYEMYKIKIVNLNIKKDNSLALNCIPRIRIDNAILIIQA